MSLTTSVVIPTYSLERWDDLVASLDALEHQTVAPEEVIVVVDGNRELFERVREEFPHVIALENSHGPGVSGARNTAAEVATGSVLAYLDDDSVPEPRWLEEHLAAYADPAVLGTGGTLVPAWSGGKPQRLPRELWWIIGCTWTGTPETPAPIRNPVGANMTLRKDVVEAAGGFRMGRVHRDGAPASGVAEETEFCLSALESHPGGYFQHRPGAVTRHAVPGARTSWSYLISRSRIEGTGKAKLARQFGSSIGLASEREYVRRILPRGIARELWAGLRGNPAGFERGTAILVSLAVTAWAYARGRLSRARSQ
jgi:glycosyltransferase involved in cell wall biosynthesis